MWEFCLNISVDNFNVARFIYNNGKKLSQKLNVIITSFEQDNIIKILFACEKDCEKEVKAYICRLIINAICQVYKEQYIKTKLLFLNEDEMFKTAITRALLNFDRETDYYIINHALVLDNNLFFESFIFFRLFSLLKKWDELIKLANENREYFLDNEAFFELIRFLIDNMEVVESEVTVIEEEGGYKILDGGFKELLSRLAPIELIGSLIDISPRKINMYLKEERREARFLENIFDDKLCVRFENFEKLQSYNILNANKTFVRKS